jgi:hypothetical protein
MDLDPHGQPYNLRFNRARRAERDLSEMLGLVKGLLADGVVNDAEAAHLATWAAHHPDAAEQWPIPALKARLDQVFADGRIDDVERRDLAELLEAIVGGTAGIIVGDDAATELPLDEPAPEIRWSGSVFVFTGKFAFGPRAECQREAIALGGECEQNITRRTRYLVLGTFGSRDWVHTAFGRKIQQAVEYRAGGVPLAIVGEDHWARALTAAVPLAGGRPRRPKPAPAEVTLHPEAVRAKIPGRGLFSLEIVGESHYQDAFERICGARTEDGENRIVAATLVPENDNPHDPLAVRVDIDGQTVGYLSRKNAREYRQQLEDAGLTGATASCQARICGGWDRGPDDQGFYGLFLDLPTDA